MQRKAPTAYISINIVLGVLVQYGPCGPPGAQHCLYLHFVPVNTTLLLDENGLQLMMAR